MWSTLLYVRMKIPKIHLVNSVDVDDWPLISWSNGLLYICLFAMTNTNSVFSPSPIIAAFARAAMRNEEGTKQEEEEE